MNLAVVGGGPAGLYCAYLLKRWRPHARVRVFEHNPRDATFGFGVVFSDRALAFLRDDDPETHDLLKPELETWQDLHVHHAGADIRIDGIGFAAIGRLRLLQLLQSHAAAAGVELAFTTPVRSLEDLRDADLIFGADGVNSMIRSQQATAFGAQVSAFTNRFAWYGTTKTFPTLSQTFVRTDAGAFNAHHYRYAAGMSTFIVETDAATWQRIGFADMDEATSRAYCEDVFSAVLDGHPLINNRTLWRNFPRIRTARWSAGNCVLIGDAAHTAHFSIGSGTRLAMEDAIALVRALREHDGDAPIALKAYETARRPIVEALVAAADASARWYEDFASHMDLPPWDFAWSYIGRSGRIDPDRLRRISPDFAARYEAYRTGS